MMTTIDTRIVSGPSAVRAAEALRKERAKRDQWPYEWEYAPPGSDRVTVIATANIPSPLVANQIVVGSYSVPSGYQFCLSHVVLAYNGGSFAPGDMNWTLDKNTPLGIASLQASVVQGFALVQIPLGSISPMYSEFPLVRNELFSPEDVIRAKVWVSANVNSGYFTAVIKGWIWPAVKG